MVGRHARYESGRDLDRAAMAGLASSNRHLPVIKLRRRPARGFGTDAGCMTGLAHHRGRHVITLFADGLDTVVTVRAADDDSGVIENRALPSGGQMTIAAFKRRHNVIFRFA